MDLKKIAAELQRDLKANRKAAITDENQLDVQALSVAEEAGELIGAYRRYTGRARRPGSWGDLVEEIADLLIVTAVFAERLGVDIDEAVEGKLKVIYSRGWKFPENE